MTPPHLHALAAAHSLDDARRRLAHLADTEAAQIAAEALEAPSVLRSTVYGGRFGSGGHSDPTPRMVAVADRPPRRNRWAEMLDRLDGRLGWICGQLPGPVRHADYIPHILDRIPALLPGTAAVVARHLADEDRWVREAIGVAALRVPLLAVDCPACRTRNLLAQAEGPREAWTVVCGGGWRDGRHNPCLCVGQGCGCGTPGAAEGWAHIWEWAAVIGAVEVTR